MNDEAIELLRDFRDCILNERGALAEAGFTSEQVNDVLAEFDDRFSALLAQQKAAPQDVKVKEATSTEASVGAVPLDASRPASAAPGSGMPEEPTIIRNYREARFEQLTTWERALLVYVDALRSYALSLREREGMVEVPNEKAITAIEILNRVGNRLYCDLPQDAKDGAKILAIAELLAAPSAGREEGNHD